MAKTMQEIITAVVTNLSMVPGVGAQVYAEDRIAQFVQRVFDLAFEEHFWHDYMEFVTRSLDGSTGTITSDVPFSRFKDIQTVWVAGTETKLTQLPRNRNPFLITGTYPKYVSPVQSDTRPLKVWPITATNDIVIAGRVKPDDFALDDEINLDHVLLEFGATWMYLEDDGHNGGAAEKYRVLYNDRFKQLTSGTFSVALSSDSRVNDSMQRWTEWP